MTAEPASTRRPGESRRGGSSNRDRRQCGNTVGEASKTNSLYDIDTTFISHAFYILLSPYNTLVVQTWQDIFFFKKTTKATTVQHYYSSLIRDNTIVNYRMKIEREDTVFLVGTGEGAENPESAPLDEP